MTYRGWRLGNYHSVEGMRFGRGCTPSAPGIPLGAPPQELPVFVESVVVTGLHCEYCVKSVTEEVSELDGVSVLDVDLSSGLVTFVSDEPVDRLELREAVELAGYRLVVPALS